MVRFCLSLAFGICAAVLLLSTSIRPASGGPVSHPPDAATQTSAGTPTENEKPIRIIKLKRGKDVYTQPRAKGKYHRGTAVKRTRFYVFEEKWGKGCKAKWVRIGERAWICSVGTRPSTKPPDNRALTELADGKLLPKEYVVTRDAKLFETLESAENSDDPQKTLRGLGGFVKGRTKRKNGQRFVNTPRGWVPASQVENASGSTFKGVHLHADDRGKRLGFVRVKRARLYDNTGRRTKKRGPVQQTYLGELSEPVEIRGLILYSIDNGDHIRERDISLIEWTSPPDELGDDPVKDTVGAAGVVPEQAISKARRWIDVSLSRQLLVAYEGERPVMATLVSTARTATTPGVYRIQKKRAFGRLRAKPEFNTQWDVHVPWVMTLDGRLAMHTVYWHDNFGKPFSQGCVNLAPIDAKWLWDWTEPHLPDGWVRVMSDDHTPGTVVRIRK